VLQLAGYTELEKIEIAKKFLSPKAVEGTGLTKENIVFTDRQFQTVHQPLHGAKPASEISERELSSICRKIARKSWSRGNTSSEEILHAGQGDAVSGVPRFRNTMAEESRTKSASPHRLAWTEVGGEILVTEATLMSGKGHLTLTGKLGDVMQDRRRRR